MNYNILSLIAGSLYWFNRIDYPMVDSLKLVSKNINHKRYSSDLVLISKSLQYGNSFDTAIHKVSHLPEIFLDFLFLGYKSNCLGKCLLFLKEYFQLRNSVKNKLYNIFLYIGMLIFTTLFVIVLLMTRIVPSFKDMYTEMQIMLPLPTQIIITISNFFLSYYFAILISIALLIFISMLLYKNTYKFKLFFDLLLLHLPIIGNLNLKLNNAIFCLFLYAQLELKIDLVTALQNLKKLPSNVVIKNDIKIIIQGIENGKSFSEAIQNSTFLSRPVKKVIKIGEKGENLSEQLEALGNEYERQVKDNLSAFISMLIPIFIVLIGMLVGFTVYALFMPMFEMVNMIS